MREGAAVSHPGRLSVALVGRQLPDNENLGVGYVEAALLRARLRVLRCMVNDPVDIAPVRQQILDRLAVQVPCFSGYVGTQWDATLRADSRSPGSHHDCTPGDGSLASQATAALANIDLPACRVSASVTGGADDDLRRFSAAVDDSGCQSFCHGSYTITLDGSKVVVGISSGPDAEPETLECIRQVLEGLEFPCLLSAQVCPEVCIIE